MFSLDELIGQNSSSGIVDQISNSIGANQSMTGTAVKVALPMILMGLARNASTPHGAESLNTALDNDHQGGLLESLGGFLGGGAPQTPETDGGGILGHVFGNNQGQVAEEVSKESGLNLGQAAKVLLMLAPIVMAFIGTEKRANNVGADGLEGLLGTLTGQAVAEAEPVAGNSIWDMATSVLDRDGDNSAVDDLASMASKYFS